MDLYLKVLQVQQYGELQLHEHSLCLTKVLLVANRLNRAS